MPVEYGAFQLFPNSRNTFFISLFVFGHRNAQVHINTFTMSPLNLLYFYVLVAITLSDRKVARRLRKGVTGPQLTLFILQLLRVLKSQIIT